MIAVSKGHKQRKWMNVVSTDPQKQPNSSVYLFRALVCVSVVFGGYFRVIPVHFKFMHYKHFNKERKARNLKLVSFTLKWSQTPLVREESQQALAFTMIVNMAFICCCHFSNKCLGFVVFGENLSKKTKQM